jgi:hypothetical protein
MRSTVLFSNVSASFHRKFGKNYGFTLILENDDVVEFHDFNGGQVLRGLGLGAGFVSGNQEESGIL